MEVAENVARLIANNIYFSGGLLAGYIYGENDAYIANDILYVSGGYTAKIVDDVLTVSGGGSASITDNILIVK